MTRIALSARADRNCADIKERKPRAASFTGRSQVRAGPDPKQ
jgi:hypothetical protein